MSEKPTQKVVWWSLEAGLEGEAFRVFPYLGLLSRGLKGAELATTTKVQLNLPQDAAGDAARRVLKLFRGDKRSAIIPAGDLAVIEEALKALVEAGNLVWRGKVELKVHPATSLRAVRNPETKKLRVLDPMPGNVLIRGKSTWCINPDEGGIWPLRFDVAADAKPAVNVRSPAAETPVADGTAGAVPASQSASPTESRRLDAVEIIDRQPKPVLRLARVANAELGLVEVACVAFDYGAAGAPALVDMHLDAGFVPLQGMTVARRHKALEAEFAQKIEATGLAPVRNAPLPPALEPLRDGLLFFPGVGGADAWRQFRREILPTLLADGWRTDGVPGVAVIRSFSAAPQVALGGSSAGGWLGVDFKIEIDGQKLDLLPILDRVLSSGGLASLSGHDDVVEVVVEDGLIVEFPRERLAKILSVIELLLIEGRSEDGHLKIKAESAEALHEQAVLFEMSEQDRQALDDFIMSAQPAIHATPVEPPASFALDLRDYQKAGLGWLQSLKSQGFGGILADDMGLGKTAQTISHILTEKEQGRLGQGALVAVPKTLLQNWQDEIARFAPSLEVVVMHGYARKKKSIDHADVVLTTYGVLARDLLLYAAEPWDLFILDEAQAIKNPSSESAKAVMKIKAAQRICLSGTPVENNLEELWSQMAFSAPGVLGGRADFADRFRVPIEKNADVARAALLQRRIRPFVLRRTKAEVAKELPPKTEMLVPIDMGQSQRDLYEAVRLSMHKDVRAALKQKGARQSFTQINTALLRMRQVCCDPRLLPQDLVKGSSLQSAKLEHLAEMVFQMVAEGRRILIFSEFTSMLDLIKAALNEMAIAWVELTGSTADRTTPVARFQAGEMPVFLISRKAGGRGLNLTAADTVIHYDPWWNPKAEDQASDRAYRIGQDKKVFVYKLVMAGTVEEKIIELQRRKAGLADVVVGEAALAGTLEEAEIEKLFAPIREAAIAA